jgi:transcriptional regulator with XRE-family HTH domain
MPPGGDPELWSLVGPVRALMTARGLSRAQLAIRIGCDRSRVSRALSARDLPPRHLIIEIARSLGMDAAPAEQQWVRCKLRRRDAHARDTAVAAGGGPPPDIRTRYDLLGALRDLMATRGISQRELARRHYWLRRSTVGAALRGDIAIREDLVWTIVRACGVTQDAQAAWRDAWRRVGRPHQQQQHRRRRDGYDSWVMRL